MATTYEPIATTTLGSAAASITFSSISSAYTDLRLVFVVSGLSSADRANIRLNSDTGTNYSTTGLRGDGTSATSFNTTNTNFLRFGNNGFSGTIPVFCTADIFSYAGSTNKTVLMTSSNDANGSGDVFRTVGLWRSTSAINSVTILAQSGGVTMSAGTTATLYGIKAA